jgi:hypothetical protein
VAGGSEVHAWAARKRHFVCISMLVTSLVRNRGSKRLGYNWNTGESARSKQASMRDNAFHEKAGRSQVDSFLILLEMVSPAELATVAMLPSALSRSESFRSVHVGRSRFSRCCHLISDLSFSL